MVINFSARADQGMCLESKNQGKLLFPEINCLGYMTVNINFFFFFTIELPCIYDNVKVKIFGSVTLK